MSKITFIGDAHGKIDLLAQIQTVHDRTIQLGDMGFGFLSIPEFGEQHKFIRGNHDDPAKARTHKNYLGDFGYLPKDNLFYISGASSIDRVWRVEGVSWWPDEELSNSELNAAIDLYISSRPNIVISHECPTEANKLLLADLGGPYFAAKGNLTSSRTCQALQTMLEAHQPRLWIFGHYHVTKDFTIGRTEFQCLAELDTLDLETT